MTNPRTLDEAPADEWKEYERQYESSFTNFRSFPDFRQAILDFRARLTAEQLGLVRAWIEIGRENPWIVEAENPPFNELSFHICQDFRELAERLLHGNWSLGQAFALENLCFINQVNGGDEWLTIREKLPFESITMRGFEETYEESEARLQKAIEDIRRATDTELRNLTY